MAHPGPVLALDVGTRTIGLARSDPSRRFVFVDPTLARKSVRADAAAIDALCARHGVTLVVVGLPIPDPGAPEARALRLARQVGEALVALGREVVFADEGYTTVEAHARLSEAGVEARARRPHIDGQAAAVLLEDWLAAQDR